ncbi:MAG: GNAT family N-acetyltransferase [Paracoccus sp. (in: a-proteobacteria)]
MTTQPMQILTPIPAALLPESFALWRSRFSPVGQGRICPGHGIVAVDKAGRLAGVMGLRDAAGGFWQPLRRPGWMLLFRACPPTADLVIDGIVAARLRGGAGRALIAAGLAEAGRRGHPGLRAEVQTRNRAALNFYRALGFVEVARGRYGWPWGGTVAVMRLPVAQVT